MIKELNRRSLHVALLEACNLSEQLSYNNPAKVSSSYKSTEMIGSPATGIVKVSDLKSYDSAQDEKDWEKNLRGAYFRE